MSSDSFFACAAFREDVAIPEAALLAVWSGVVPNERRAKLVAADLADLSLFTRDEQRCYRIHDLYVDYLHHAAGPLPARHASLVERYRTACPTGWASGPDDGYFFEHLPLHLVEAGKLDDLCATLTDVDQLGKLCSLLAPRRSSDRLERFLTTALSYIPAADLLRYRKLANISGNLRQFLECLTLFHPPFIDAIDPKAVCQECGQRTICHLYVDLGGVEIYDNYAVWCLSCFWCLHEEYFQQAMYADPVWEFDYDRNVYRP